MALSMREKIINHILETEGGFVDDPSDSGGPTKFGITQSVAREFGYNGLMEDLPRETAFAIYSRHYWHAVRADELLVVSAKITEEIVDTGVNLGPGTAVKFLQRVLNVFNLRANLYDDLLLDGQMGPKTFSAFKECYRTRGESVIMLALNCLQGAYYIALAERHPKNERFVCGWLTKRVQL